MGSQATCRLPHFPLGNPSRDKNYLSSHTAVLRQPLRLRCLLQLHGAGNGNRKLAARKSPRPVRTSGKRPEAAIIGSTRIVVALGALRNTQHGTENAPCTNRFQADAESSFRQPYRLSRRDRANGRSLLRCRARPLHRPSTLQPCLLRCYARPPGRARHACAQHELATRPTLPSAPVTSTVCPRFGFTARSINCAPVVTTSGSAAAFLEVQCLQEWERARQPWRRCIRHMCRLPMPSPAFLSRNQ